ncbi:phosphotransferase [Streptomyces sp. NPDC051018]|uniref:phosphotransferase n=1 Tax=Streptomyces sp. NPDC051018 TaxID=3365639 RepID=UPI0037AA3882
MTVELASDVRRRAGELSHDGQDVEGPLKGYHNETYAIPLPPENALSRRFARGKYRAPRPGVLWYDRRCFASEDRLLLALQGRITRIPEVVEISENVFVQGFVEGRPLGGGTLSGRSLSAHHERQLGRLFQELVTFGTGALGSVPRTDCAPGDHPRSEDTPTAFLNRLIDFTLTQVHDENVKVYGTLFEGLGASRDALERLRTPAGLLGHRPFTLVHGDLHRHNFIVDRAGDLWTIDWELAMIGDPLYDLATHFHLMGYSPRAERRVADLWVAAMESAWSPESTKGWEADLARLLAYKRVQSVFTDVVRAAKVLETGAQGQEAPGRTDGNWRVLRAARKVRRALVAARVPLGLPAVPTLTQVRTVYLNWLRASEG